MNSIQIQYIGQVGFIFRKEGFSIAVDPYLTDSVDQLTDFPSGYWKRRYAPPVQPQDVRGLDLVLITHEHLDHLDPETLQGIAEASPSCRFAAPAVCLPLLRACGFSDDRLYAMHVDQPLLIGPVVVHPIPAWHEKREVDAAGYDRYLGYVLEWSGLWLYHAGDTIVTEGLLEALSPFPLDIGFLPINGRDLFRNRLGVVGNMNARDAVELAAALQLDTVVPTHFDLYPNNGEAPGVFVDHLHKRNSGVKTHQFQPGETYLYQKNGKRQLKVAIVGAGKTGRGFAARFALRAGAQLTFIDHSPSLVEKLQQDGAYTIHYFGSGRSPVRVDGVVAACSGTEAAIEAIAEADLVFTAVGEQNLKGIAGDLLEGMTRRFTNGNHAPGTLITCENGVRPGHVLRESLLSMLAANEPVPAWFPTVVESAIFCSTIELPGTRLDIQSEAYEELPYDSLALPAAFALPGMVPEPRFKELLQRKIYTYNCISACIAYLGALRGYELYADAANDPDIDTVIAEVLEPLNRVLAVRLEVPLGDQIAFSQQALRKFKDFNIRDDIARNARDVARKLGPEERMIAPVRMLVESGAALKDIQGLALVTAAALHYKGPSELKLQAQLTQKGLGSTLSELTLFPTDHPFLTAVARYYDLLSRSDLPPFTELLQEATLL